MGEIVGAAIVAHIPPIVMPADLRYQLYGGKDTSLVPGLHRMRAERLDVVRPDTVIVIDTHWFSTFEYVVSAHDRRAGRYTSEELPRTIAGLPYDFPGDPELADALAAAAARRGDTWIHATRDPYIAIHYPTVNLLPFLQRDEKWVSVSVCQTATKDDHLRFGQVLAEVVASLDRRVVVLGSGGLSHKFLPLRELRQREGAGPENMHSPEALAADLAVIERFEAGDHAAVLDGYDQYRKLSPEGFFAHYLMMAGALGGRDCTAKAVKFSEYEAAVGTGQVHLWFDRAQGGWTS